MPVDPKYYKWVDPETLSTLTHDGTWDTYTDRWWAADAAGNIAFYKTHPQCNSNRDITEQVGRRIPGYAQAILVPMVYLPHRCDG